MCAREVTGSIRAPTDCVARLWTRRRPSTGVGVSLPRRSEHGWDDGMDTHTTQEITDIVALVPHCLGYVPGDSLVLVAGTSTARGTLRLGPVLRCDLGPAEAEAIAAHGAAAGRRLTESLRLVDDLAAVFPIVYRSDLAESLASQEADPPACDRSDALADVLASLLAVGQAIGELGVDAGAPLWATADACGVIGSGEVRSADDLACAPVAVALVSAGSSAASSFESAVALPEPSCAQTSEVEALRASEPCLDDVIEALRGDVIALARAGDGEGRLPSPAPGAVLALEELCSAPATRDIAQMLFSLDHPMLSPADLEEMPAGALLDAALELVGDPDSCAEIIGLSEREPKFHRLRASVDYLRTAAPLVDEAALPGVLSLIAWYEWARGVPSTALHFARAALAASSGYGLAELIESAVETGIDPRWRRTAPVEHALSAG